MAVPVMFTGWTIKPFRHSIKLVPQCLMPSVLARTSARLLASSANYLEATAVISVVAASRFLFKPFIWTFSPGLCVSIATAAALFLYACLDKGQIFTYLGWVAPRRPVYWLYAVLAGLAGAVAALFVLRGIRLSVGSAPATELLYGVTLGPLIEEVIFRGAAFSVVYVTACSAKILTHWRIGISVLVTSLLFVWSHTRTIGIPWIMIFSMSIGYALMRWRSNSTGTAALMHAIYNGVIAIAMIHPPASSF
jgi:membrane protease YdiL (CAAX protease family)